MFSDSARGCQKVRDAKLVDNLQDDIAQWINYTVL